MFKLELNTALLLRTVVVHISTYGGYYLSIKKKNNYRFSRKLLRQSLDDCTKIIIVLLKTGISFL